MTLNLKAPEVRELKPRILVCGVGGAGGNAVNNMIVSGLPGVDFLVCNTDAQALTATKAERVVQMGLVVTEGLGAGSKPEVGRAAAEEAIGEIRDHLSGAHMLFVTAGMGGGTGTGAAPVIARTAREMNILTVGVVTKPFQFEGARRMRVAEAGIAELQDAVDTLIVIPNQNLFRVANEKTTFADAFAMADQVLYAGVACITDLMVKEGLINLDFADVKAIMSDMGKAMMGTGEATGERRALEAAEAAISNPLLDETTMRGACGLLISITGGNDLTLYEVDEAASRIRQEVDEDANIILGATYDQSLDGIIRVSVVATGIDAERQQGAKSRPSEDAPVLLPERFSRHYESDFSQDYDAFHKDAGDGEGHHRAAAKPLDGSSYGHKGGNERFHQSPDYKGLGAVTTRMMGHGSTGEGAAHAGAVGQSGASSFMPGMMAAKNDAHGFAGQNMSAARKPITPLARALGFGKKNSSTSGGVSEGDFNESQAGYDQGASAYAHPYAHPSFHGEEAMVEGSYGQNAYDDAENGLTPITHGAVPNREQNYTHSHGAHQNAGYHQGDGYYQGADEAYANAGQDQFLSPSRMPKIEEFPMPAQRQLRSREAQLAGGEAGEASHHTRRKTLLEKLAGFGMNREPDEMPKQILPQNAAQGSAAGPSAVKPAARSARPSLPRAPHGGQDPRAFANSSQYRDGQGRTVTPPAHPVPPMRFEDEHLEIPAFLRRQA